MRAPYAYYGGKSGIAPTIAALFPEHRVYLEPFFGSGAVFFAKRPAVHEILNDVDDAVVNFFYCLRHRRAELEEACWLTPHARTEFDQADMSAEVDDIERARRFWVRVNQSFAKTAGVQTGWSVTTARTQAVPASIAGRLGRFEACANRMIGATWEHCDAADLVKRLATPDSVTYADPPYLASTRRSRRAGTACNDYRHDMGSDEDHERLAEVLRTCSGAVYLSGYHSPLYDSLYKDWDRIEWSMNLHSSNAVTVERGKRTEVLWSNRELVPPAQGSMFDEDFGT